MLRNNNVIIKLKNLENDQILQSINLSDKNVIKFTES